MKTIRHAATLFYYDGAQVFEARDAIGGHYIAVMIERASGRDHYLVAGVEPERLRQFRTGKVDLRTLLIERAEIDWFLGYADLGIDQPMTIVQQGSSLGESSWLPEPGFVLHEQPASSEVLRAARERHNLVLELALEPPEAAEEHRIHVPTLVGFLAHLQAMVKQAYASALRDVPQGQRRETERLDAHLMDVVVPAAAGSFRIVLEAAKSRQYPMFGQSELARALYRVDTLFEEVSNPSRALDTAKRFRGHLAGSYLRLLRFLVESDSGLRYSWAEPEFEQSRNRGVTRGEVGPLVDVLSTVSNLGEESIELVGVLKKADIDSGQWRLAIADGERSGKTREGSPSLAGLEIDRTYRFRCIEAIEEAEISGVERRSLFLVAHEPA